MRDVLVINSYAGSLVLGAKAAGIPILASMEDCGYGIAAQKLNFPELKYVDRHPWPTFNLGNLEATAVIAHPPCAAFSNMNIVEEKKGLGTDAFGCHRKVMDYALGNGCEALAIESVTGALKFAQEEYLNYAAKYGYDCVFLLLNAVSFGVPQWRARFWVLFFREKRELYKFQLEPRYVNLESVLDGKVADDEVTLKHVRYLKRKYESANFKFEEMMASDRVQPGGFDKLARQHFVELGVEVGDIETLKALTGTKGLYRAGLPRKLDPTLFAPVILGFTLWYVNDRPLNRVEYQRIMGFPDDWKWPGKEGKDFLTYLSKGVCPPVATWILQQLQYQQTSQLRADFTHTCSHGQVLDLQPEKKVVEEFLRNPPGSPRAGLTGQVGANPRTERPPLLTTDQTEGTGTSGYPDRPRDTNVGRASKPFTCQVTFSERPRDGDVLRYEDREGFVRWLELELRRKDEVNQELYKEVEGEEVVREVQEVGEGKLPGPADVPRVQEPRPERQVGEGWGNYRG